MKFTHILLSFLLAVTLTGFGQSSSNPAQPGFNADGSDQKAIEIADKVMTALGGRRNWDNTRHVTWKFFGRRLLVWDKWTGDYRLEADTLTVLMNVNSGKGRAWVKGKELTNPEKIQSILRRAKSIWINDSYWMFMPYKLKDSGVTLKYRGEAQSEAGQACQVLQLSFEDVGDTPENKYLVYVDNTSSRVVQWSFFRKASDPEPAFTYPWANWKPYGNIRLNNDFGGRKHSDIAVFEQLPAKVYESPEPVDIMKYQIGAIE